jgi:hypothetical protein
MGCLAADTSGGDCNSMSTPETTLDDIGTIDPAYPPTPLRQVLAGRLSHAAGFRLLVAGHYTAREIGILIRQLEVTRDALS